MPAEVCFVVPSYLSRSSIQSTLDSILAQKTERRIDVLVVDSSPDKTADWLKALFPQVRILKSDGRLFPGRARNQGARHTDAPLLAFIDADATAAPDWLETLLRSQALRPEISLIGGAVVNANPHSLPGLILYWIEFSEYLPGLRSGFRTALSSSNLLVRRDQFLDRGGFDGDFAMAEDLILCRKWEKGLYFEADAKVFHRQRSTWQDVSKHLDALGYWSGRYRASHQTAGSWLRTVPLLSFGLPAVRIPRILVRLARSHWKEGAKGLLLLPLLTWGLLSWASGFYRGLRKPADRGSQTYYGCGGDGGRTGDFG